MISHRKNQKDVSKILFGVKVSLTNYETKIFNISVNDEKNENNEILDNLIYDFNNKSIKVNNWISLKSFVNKILSSYSGWVIFRGSTIWSNSLSLISPVLIASNFKVVLFFNACFAIFAALS